VQIEVLGEDFEVGPQAFLDCAAVMKNLDLVISIDTSIAHLAGALGRPVWILLKKTPDWRWGLDGVSTPWYSSARLYRQTGIDDWASAFSTLEQDLRGILDKRADGSARTG
jgi:ADP-heptose:LPS heptosyltransferase